MKEEKANEPNLGKTSEGVSEIIISLVRHQVNVHCAVTEARPRERLGARCGGMWSTRGSLCIFVSSFSGFSSGI